LPDTPLGRIALINQNVIDRSTEIVQNCTNCK